MNDLERRAMAADAVRRQQQNKPVDPLPVMKEIAGWLEAYERLNREELSFTRRLCDAIAQIERERRQTAAAAHVRKLKEGR